AERTPSPQDDSLRAGFGLLQALMTGQARLTDRAKLEALQPLVRGARMQAQLEQTLTSWHASPFGVSVNLDAPVFATAPLSARVQQYQLSSLDALHAKLAQFPAGTRFVLQVSGPAARAQALDTDLRSFLAGRNMVVVEK